MKYFFCLALFVLLSGCEASIKTPVGDSETISNTGPFIEFFAKTDMTKWDRNAQDVRWGIAVSKSDITLVVKNGWSYNEPVYGIGSYDEYVIKSGIKSFERVLVLVDAGIHDWLILLDLDNYGDWDRYLGSAQEYIKLDNIKFEKGCIYSVVVGEDSIARLEIKPVGPGLAPI